MKWLNLGSLRDHRFMPLNRILLLAIVICFLGGFNQGFTIEPTEEPSNIYEPTSEHPWDDLNNIGSNGNDPADPPNEISLMIIQLGVFGSCWVDFYSVPSSVESTKETVCGSAGRNGGRVLMLIR